MLEKISIDAWCSHQADRLSDNPIKRGRHAHGHPVFKGVLQGRASRACFKGVDQAYQYSLIVAEIGTVLI